MKIENLPRASDVERELDECIASLASMKTRTDGSLIIKDAYNSLLVTVQYSSGNYDKLFYTAVSACIIEQLELRRDRLLAEIAAL